MEKEATFNEKVVATAIAVFAGIFILGFFGRMLMK